MSKNWIEKIEELDYAFQPIVNPYAGSIYGVEALLRNTEKLGYKEISEFFDDAYSQGVLFNVDIMLREKAISKFITIPFCNKIKLFYNYDPRILEMNDYKNGFTENILQKYNLDSQNICFEINEKYQILKIDNLRNFINGLKERNIKVALDDFGAGFSGLELFYHSDPDFIKFDRFLISGIDNDIKKKSFCSHIISLCKLFGIIVIAEGVETLAEFYTCKDIGFDLIQGFFIQRPQIEVASLQLSNDNIKNLISRRKNISKNEEMINNEMIVLDTISVDDNIKIIFEKFHENLNYNFFPVVDSNNYPMGILHEKKIKSYVYSPYGKELLYNKSFNKSISKFLSFCPVADINTSQEAFLEIFVNNPESQGILITKEMKYVGFLNAKSLLNMINLKNLSYAREINPLTKLPGNMMINEYIGGIFENNEHNFYLVYFDFDNFKPFNDKFGFRQGDRAILYFADLLRKEAHEKERFIGHIGGDDFFVGFKSDTDIKEKVIQKVLNIVDDFSNAMLSFFDKEDVERGYYFSKDRNGELCKFAFLSVSAGIIEIEKDFRDFSDDTIGEVLAVIKKDAKSSKMKISYKKLGVEVYAYC
ncbi:MAG TPA: GGDEF domain-containing protein [Spirochaetota bacterium]|jgi:diguanylate cyclase (GGDEF)-like protein|nr:MAG: Blue light- and temperature-regulated antirepressor YcgF [Spirochaetes bacterium ADurb.Bin133]HNZ27696.1 GGDEF domain-containing protein [Spirochaetota bacterium]HPY87562.1 GGDEF domain-containing protein [Spirochaetota bacterium]HQB60204.1 GGDEF domain-containing protein [Spirochaetota bacterium]